MLRLLSVVTLGFCLGLIGCKTVQPKDLVGTWVMTDSSRSILPDDLKHASGKIILNANGTFSASEMPGLFYAPGLYAARLENGTGTWKIISEDGEERLLLNFQTIAKWNDSLPYGNDLFIGRGNLFYFLDDPDEGRRVSFEKK